MTLQQQIHRFDFSGEGSFPVPNLLDPSGLTLASTDAIFDARAAAGYDGGVLPAPGAQIPAAGLVGLQRANVPLLERTAIGYTAPPVTSATRPDYIGGGWSFDGRTALYVRRSDLATYHEVWDPISEGFLDHLLIVWLRSKTTAPAGTVGIIGSGVGAMTTSGFHFGFVQVASGTIQEASSAVVLSGPTALRGGLHQLAVHRAYDVGGDTTTYRLFCDGREVGTATAEAAHKPSQHTKNTAAPGGGGSCATIGRAAGYGDWGNGTIYRVDRHFTRIEDPDRPGEYETADPARIIANDYAAHRLIF